MISHVLAGWCSILLNIKQSHSNWKWELATCPQQWTLFMLCTAFISREVFHVVNPTIPYISQFLQQDLGSNILLWDLSLEESDMKKEVLNRLCVGESGGEMVIFHKKQCQKSSWRHPAPGIGQVSCETASEMVAGGFNCSRLWAFDIVYGFIPLYLTCWCSVNCLIWLNTLHICPY